MTGQDDSETTGQARSERLNEFLRSEPFWLAAAFVSGVLVVATTSIAALIALFTLSGSLLSERVDVIYKLALIGVGAVTFCTVVWRGLISTRQADAQLRATSLQREQIDKLALQIAATEETTLADLLQQGAELIGESSKKPHVAAGIAILQSVLEAPNRKFASQAMNLLADFVQDNYTYGTPDNLIGAAIAALGQGATLDRYSSRRLSFDARSLSVEQSREDEWKMISGVAAVRYLGGVWEGSERSALNAKTKFSFIEVRIESADIDVRKHMFRGCHFERCEIRGISAVVAKRNQFESCDFSGAEIQTGSGFPDLRDQGNHYFAENPPQGRIRTHWSTVLNVIEPMPDDDILSEGEVLD